MSAAAETDLRDAAAHVLWVYREDGGMQPGSFVEALIKAMQRADRENLTLLGTAFPNHAKCVWRWRFASGGSEAVKVWAAGGAS